MEENTQTTAAAPTQADSAKAALPDIISLYKNALAFVKARLDLLVIVPIPLLIIAAATVSPETGGDEPIPSYAQSFLAANGLEPVPYLLSGLVFVASAIYLINMAVMLHAVHQSSEDHVSYKESFSWAKSNFWSYLWIFFLTLLITSIGYILLIIPGIIASGFLAFSLFVFYNENKKGSAALKRSYQLVKGRWWSVVLRYVGVFILIFITAAIAGIVVGIVSEIFGGSEMMNNIITELLRQIIAVAISLMGLHVGKELYTALATSRPDAPSSDTAGVPS